jgi:hypothetical protein
MKLCDIQISKINYLQGDINMSTYPVQNASLVQATSNIQGAQPTYITEGANLGTMGNMVMGKLMETNTQSGGYSVEETSLSAYLNRALEPLTKYTDSSSSLINDNIRHAQNQALSSTDEAFQLPPQIQTQKAELVKETELTQAQLASLKKLQDLAKSGNPIKLPDDPTIVKTKVGIDGEQNGELGKTFLLAKGDQAVYDTEKGKYVLTQTADENTETLAYQGGSRPTNVKMVGGPNTKTLIAQAGNGDKVTIKAGDNDNEILAVAAEKGSTLRVKAEGGDDITYIEGKTGADEIQYQPGTGENDVAVINGGDGKNEYWVGGGASKLSTMYVSDGKDAGYINISNSRTGIDKVNVNAGGGDDYIDVNLWHQSQTGDKFEIDGGEGKNKLNISCPSPNFVVKDPEGNIIFQRGEGGAEITVKDIYQIHIDYTGGGVSIRANNPEDGKSFDASVEPTIPITGNNAYCIGFDDAHNKRREIEKISTSTNGYMFVPSEE